MEFLALALALAFVVGFFFEFVLALVALGVAGQCDADCHEEFSFLVDSVGIMRFGFLLKGVA
jgi:hypothetical protein